MSIWSSGIGKFVKKDPKHGAWLRKIKHWLCRVGLCNLDKCNCDCHDSEDGDFGERKAEEPPKARKKVFDPARGGWVLED
jgi:hypothetical protein